MPHTARRSIWPPKCALYWADLGCVLWVTPGRVQDAEAALRRAAHLDPKNATLWGILGLFVFSGAGRPKDAVAALRMSGDLGTDSPHFLVTLGVLLYCE